MTREEMLLRVEKILELDAGSLKIGPPDNVLGEIDSLAVLSIMSLVNEHFDISLKARELYATETTDQLIEKIGPERFS